MAKDENSHRFIPIYDWIMEDTELSLLEVLVLCCVIDGEFENIPITIQYISNIGFCDKRSIYRVIKSLKEQGLLNYVCKDNIVEKLKNKRLAGFGIGNLICQWCGISTSVLHEHHYPIPKIEGGKLTVNICPNCHSEYHYNNILVAKRKHPINQKYRKCEKERRKDASLSYSRLGKGF